MQFFSPSRRLEDVPIEQRLAAVERLLAADPAMPEAERWQLFGLVISPQDHAATIRTIVPG